MPIIVPVLPVPLLPTHGVVSGADDAWGTVFILLGPVPLPGVCFVLSGDEDDPQEDILLAGSGGVPVFPVSPGIASLLLFIGDSLASKFCIGFCPNLKGSLSFLIVPDSFPHPSYLLTISRTVFVTFMVFLKINVSLCCLLFSVFRLSTLCFLSTFCSLS